LSPQQLPASRRTDAAVTPSSIQILALPGLGEIHPHDTLEKLIFEAARNQRFSVHERDVFVIAQKIISKAEGRIVQLDSIVPSARAIEWAAEWKKDARHVEVVLRESKRIVRMERGLIIAETHHGFVCANAGVDASNAPEGCVILLPEDSDRSARELQGSLTELFGMPVGVIISDTFGRPWRRGLTNVALGVAGFAPLLDYRGTGDRGGKILHATVLAIADEIAAAAELVMGKSEGMPVAIVRGAPEGNAGAGAMDLVRDAESDLFR
jgi:coenzyme F420-0:L-glutamate ligase/coenzyme F420-1:gamma-L-glutamate ligase